MTLYNYQEQESHQGRMIKCKHSDEEKKNLPTPNFTPKRNPLSGNRGGFVEKELQQENRKKQNVRLFLARNFRRFITQQD